MGKVSKYEQIVNGVGWRISFTRFSIRKTHDYDCNGSGVEDTDASSHHCGTSQESGGHQGSAAMIDEQSSRVESQRLGILVHKFGSSMAWIGPGEKTRMFRCECDETMDWALTILQVECYLYIALVFSESKYLLIEHSKICIVLMIATTSLAD